MTEIVATCQGLRIPASNFLNPTRIKRISASRYEGEEIAGALHVVEPSDRVLELGAGLGIVGAVTALNRHPQAVLSFEANPALLPHINALYAENGLTERIRVVNKVLLCGADQPEKATFHIHSSYLGSSLFDNSKRRTTAVDVETADFNETAAEFGATILLMDIEGAELELLRQIDLTRFRAVVLEFHSHVYGIAGMKECKNILRKAGFSKVKEKSSRTVWTCVRVESKVSKKMSGQDEKAVALAPPSPTGGWSTQISDLLAAIIVPPPKRSFITKSGVLDAKGVPCASAALWRKLRPMTLPPEMPSGDIEKLPGTWIWGGVMAGHFGHFLMESTGRLWGLPAYPDADGIIFVPRGPKLTSLFRWQEEFFALAGVTKRILLAGGPLQVERLLVPGQGLGLGTIVQGTQPTRDFFSLFGAEVPADGNDRLYISRSGLTLQKGLLIGERELEEKLAANGYEIFHPQKHPLKVQVARYKAAREIIAAEGSAIHFFGMVARPHQRVAMIIRRQSSATTQINQHLRSFAGIDPLNLDALRRTWARPNQPRARLSLGELDLPRLQVLLANKGFITTDAPAWRHLEESEIAARIGRKYQPSLSNDIQI
jgi:FkbM family methyltransferase